jgi:hypothetical protein
MHSTSKEELCRKLQQSVRHLQILAKSRGEEADNHSKMVQEKTFVIDDLQTQLQEASDTVLELQHQLDISHRETESLRQEAEDEQQGQTQINLEELQHIQVHHTAGRLKSNFSNILTTTIQLDHII